MENQFEARTEDYTKEELLNIIRELDAECKMKSDYIIELEECQRQDRGEIGELHQQLRDRDNCIDHCNTELRKAHDKLLDMGL